MEFLAVYLENSNLLLVFLCGITASVFDAMVGGAGLIIIPFLLSLGLPPVFAVGTSRFGSVGMSLSSFAGYIQTGQVQFRKLLPLSLIALTGGILGGYYAKHVPPRYFVIIVGAAIALCIPLIIFKPKVGIDSFEVSGSRKKVGYALCLFLMVFGACFGVGAGPLIIVTLMFCFGLTVTQASATLRLPGFIMAVSSLTIFICNKHIDYSIAITLAIGMLLGGYLGARTAVKVGNRAVKGLFVVVTLSIAGKLIFLT